ncbi:hypothetical protein ACJX0J_015357, partial [Zea mays]
MCVQIILPLLRVFFLEHRSICFQATLETSNPLRNWRGFGSGYMLYMNLILRLQLPWLLYKMKCTIFAYFKGQHSKMKTLGLITQCQVSLLLWQENETLSLVTFRSCSILLR